MMNPLIIIGVGVGLVTWGFKEIMRNPEKPLTVADEGGITPENSNAKVMPSDQNQSDDGSQHDARGDSDSDSGTVPEKAKSTVTSTEETDP